MAIVKLENVTKSYPMGKVTVPALCGVSIDFTEGDFVAIAGPSGSGKTTILNIIGLIDAPTDGTVSIADRDIGRLRSAELTQLRQKTLGFIFQSFNLLSGLNVFENVELPLLIGRAPLSKKERREWIDHLLDEVGLSERRRHRPAELSGGQQQRVAIARALATKPRIVIADEPTANLDSATGHAILALMKRINAERRTTFIFSTHDPVIHEMADHVIFLKDGRIEREHRRENGAAG